MSSGSAEVTPTRDPGKRDVVVQTSLYTLAVLIQQVAGVALLVLLIHRLSPQEYTRFGLLTSVYTLLVPLVSLNIQLAPSRLFFDETTAEGRAAAIGSALFGGLALGAAGTLLCLGILYAAQWGDPVTFGSWGLRLGVAGTILCIIITQFGATLYRVIGSGISFVVMISMQSIVLILAFLLLSDITSGVPSLVWSYLIAQGAAASLVLHTGFFRWGRPRVRLQAVRSAVRFTWPTAVHVLALWAVVGSGRWIGALSLTLESMTPYVLITQLVAVVGAFQRGFFDARIPAIASGFASQDPVRARAVISRTAVLAGAVGLVFYASLAIVLIAVPSILPSSFRPTMLMLGLATLASLLDASYLRGVQILHYSKRTGHQAVATLCAGALSVLLALLLVETLGVEGLLAALVAGVGLQALFSNALTAERFATGLWVRNASRLP